MDIGNIIITVIISLLLSAATGITVYKLTPKTINNITEVKATYYITTQQRQSSLQGQYTFIINGDGIIKYFNTNSIDIFLSNFITNSNFSEIITN